MCTTVPMSSNNDLLIIASECNLQYLDEGGANVVFTILPANGMELPDRLASRLLRMRKDSPHALSTEQQYKAFETNFKHLFREEYLIEHELVRLADGMPALLNDTLKKSLRPTNRHNDTFPEDERYAFLVTDMTPKAGEGLVQLKPKWLAQSTSAPANAKRCRTCALRAQRASKHIKTATDEQEYCPLGLISDNVDERTRAAQCVTTDLIVQEYLVHDAQTLLRQLREYQQSCDVPNSFDGSDRHSIANTCKAMTLRDCTLFLKRSGEVIEARLGDFDLKSPKKMTRWRAVEQSLISNGWYTNAEDKTDWTEENVCLLSR